MAAHLQPISVLNLALVALTGFALLEWLLLPRLRQSIAQAKDPLASVSRIGWYGMFAYLRTVCGIGVAACVFVGVLLGVLWARSGAVEREEVDAAVAFFERANAFFAWVRPLWWAIATGVIVVGMALVARARSRMGSERFLNQQWKEALQNLQAEQAEGRLPEIPPDEVMTRILAEIQAADALLNEVLNGKPSGLSPFQRADLRRVAESQIAELAALYRLRDLERRIDRSKFDLSGFIVDPVAPNADATTLKNRFSHFFTAHATLRFLDRGTRWLLVGSLLLSLLSTLGFMSHAAEGQVAREVTRLKDVQLAFNVVDEALLSPESAAPVADLQQKVAALQDELNQQNAQSAADSDVVGSNRQDYARQYDAAKAESDAAKAEWQSIRAEQEQHARTNPPRGPIDITAESPPSAERAAELKRSGEQLESFRQRLQALAESPASRLDEARTRSTEFVEQAADKAQQRTEKVSEHESSIAGAGDQLAERVRTQSLALDQKINQLSKISETTASTELRQKALDAVQLAQQRKAELSESQTKLTADLGKLNQQVLDSKEQMQALQSRIAEFRTSLANSPWESPDFVDQLPAEQERLRRQIELTQAEFVTENARLNPRPVLPDDAKLVERLSDSFEAHVAAKLASFTPEEIEAQLKSSRSGSVREALITQHVKRTKGRSAPETFLNSQETPAAVKPYFGLWTARGPPGSTVRDGLNRFLTSVVPYLTPQQKSVFAAASPPRTTATMQEFARALLRQAAPDWTLGFANDFAAGVVSSNPEMSERVASGKRSEDFSSPELDRWRQDFVERWSPETEQIARLIRERPPTVESMPLVEGMPATDYQKSLTEQEKLKKTYEDYYQRLPERVREAAMLSSVSPIETYDSHFPGQDPPPESGPSPGVGPGPKRPPPSLGGNNSLARQLERRYSNVSPTSQSFSQASARSFSRSRSFVRLRGFSRVGGVLIGRAPDRPADDVTAFDDFGWEWNTDRSKVCVKLKDASGAWETSEWHDPRLVALALAYAADGRPVTVTMVTSSPLLELKILVHPTLVDTSVGHHAIELDRFVDKYTGDAEFRQQSTQRVIAAKEIYKLAWALRLKQLATYGIDSLEGPTDAQSMIAVYRQQFAIADEILAGAEAAFAEYRQHLSDLSSTPATERREYFDAELVALIEDALTSTSFEAFSNAVSARSFAMIKQAVLDAGGDDQVLQWVKQNPKAWLTHMLSVAQYEHQVDEYNRKVQLVNNLAPENETLTPDLDFQRRLQLQLKLAFPQQSRAETIQWLEQQRPIIEAQQRAIELEEDRLNKCLFSVLKITQSWFLPSPDFEVWSGVRESDYSLTSAELLWRGDKSTLALTFMLQTAFTTSPYFDSDGRPKADDDDDGEQDVADSVEPWMFPQIHAAIQDTVHQSLEPADRETLAVMAEFTCLQRLFRCILDEHMSESFPVERLSALDADLGDQLEIPYVRTARWNARPGQLELLAAIQFQLQKLVLEEALNEVEGTWANDSRQLWARLESAFAQRQAALENLQTPVAEDQGAPEGETASDSAEESNWDAKWAQYQASVQAFEQEIATIAEALAKLSSEHPELEALSGMTVMLAQFDFALQLRRQMAVDHDDQTLLRAL